jgi:hypothetical protein
LLSLPFGYPFFGPTLIDVGFENFLILDNVMETTIPSLAPHDERLETHEPKFESLVCVQTSTLIIHEFVLLEGPPQLRFILSVFLLLTIYLKNVDVDVPLRHILSG